MPPIPNTSPLARLLDPKSLSRWSEQLVTQLEDILRTLKLPAQTLTLTNGLNNNLNTKGFSLIRVTGPTGAFTVSGISGGSVGSLILLHNDTIQNMTIANENASSGSNNRIQTMTGGDVTSTGVALAFLIYGLGNRWLLVSLNG